MIRRALSKLKRETLWIVAFDDMIKKAVPAYDPALRDVYDERGIALVHIPKNAGTSVEQALYGRHSVKHRPWREIRDLDPVAWERWLKIAITRDPVQRFLSAYDYLSKGGRNQYDAHFGARMVAGRTVNGMLFRMRDDDDFRTRAMAYFHFRPQSDYVMDGDRLVVDVLIPIERLGTDLPRLADFQAKLLEERKNITAGRRTLESDLDPEAFDVLKRLYASDVALHKRALESELPALQATETQTPAGRA